VGKLAGWTAERPGGGSGERIAEALGGAGVIKAAAAGGAVVAATATLASGIHTSLAPHPSRHHRSARSAAVRHVPAHRLRANAAVAAPPVSTQRVRATKTPQAIHLTPRQHAELEFSSLRSPRSRTSQRSAERATAATVPASETDSSPSTEVTRRPSANTSSSEGSGPSQAAREFGQP
jgi:hypothetical protein